MVWPAGGSVPATCAAPRSRVVHQRLYCVILWRKQVGTAGFHHWQQHTRTLGGALGRAASTAVGGAAAAGGVDRHHLGFEFGHGCARNDSGARRACPIQY